MLHDLCSHETHKTAKEFSAKSPSSHFMENSELSQLTASIFSHHRGSFVCLMPVWATNTLPRSALRDCTIEIAQDMCALPASEGSPLDESMDFWPTRPLLTAPGGLRHRICSVCHLGVGGKHHSCKLFKHKDASGVRTALPDIKPSKKKLFWI